MDQFVAGYADAMTAGWSTRARAGLYGEIATINHQGMLFHVGQGTGAAYGLVLGYGAGANSARAAQYYTVVETGLAGADIVDRGARGDLTYIDALYFAPAAGHAFGRTMRGADDLLSAPDPAIVRRLQTGVDVEVPAGTQGIRTMMSDLTLATGNEVALLRTMTGTRVMRMGGPATVPLDRTITRVIAHTHPSGHLAFSPADIRALTRRGQRSSVIIDPNADMGTVIRVPTPIE